MNPRTLESLHKLGSINEQLTIRCDAYLNVLTKLIEQQLKPKLTDTEDVIIYKSELVEYLMSQLRKIPR